MPKSSEEKRSSPSPDVDDAWLRSVLHRLPLTENNVPELIHLKQLVQLEYEQFDDQRRFWQITAENGVTYVGEERYTDKAQTQVALVFYDTQHQTYYWQDEQQDDHWVVEHPQTGDCQSIQKDELEMALSPHAYWWVKNDDRVTFDLTTQTWFFQTDHQGRQTFQTLAELDAFIQTHDAEDVIETEEDIAFKKTLSVLLSLLVIGAEIMKPVLTLPEDDPELDEPLAITPPVTPLLLMPGELTQAVSLATTQSLSLLTPFLLSQAMHLPRFMSPLAMGAALVTNGIRTVSAEPQHATTNTLFEVASKEKKAAPYDSRVSPQLLAVGDEFQINTFTAGQQQNPCVAALSDGGFVVVWQSFGQDGDSYGVYGQRYDAAGNPVGNEFQVNTYSTDDQETPSVTALLDGGFVVTWHSFGQDGSSDGVYGQRCDAMGNKAGGEFRVNTFKAGYQVESSVVGLLNGGFVVTWASNGQDPLHFHIYGQLYNAVGGTVGSEFWIDTAEANIGSSFFPQVAALLGGGFMVAWQKTYSQSNTDVYGQRYDVAGGAVGGRFRVNPLATSHHVIHSAAALSDGGFVVTWWYSGAHYAQRYDAAGNRMGNEFWVNTFGSSSVAALLTGGFVITLNRQDNEGSGIYGRMFNDAPAIILSAGNGSYTENSASVTVDSGLILSDEVRENLQMSVDGGLLLSDTNNKNLQSAQVSITNFQSGDVLSFDNQLNITGFYDNVTGTLTLLGDGTLINYQTALCNVRFRNDLDDPDTTTRNINITVNDGSFDSIPVSLIMNIVAINDPPVLEPHQFVIDQGRTLRINSSMLSATDVDNPAGNLMFQVTNVENGYFQLSQTAGVPLTNFTQAAVTQEEIEWVSDTSPNPSSFWISVSDGELSTEPVPANVTFIVNPPPELYRNYTLPPAFPNTPYEFLLPNDTFIDPAGEPLVRIMTGLPKGLHPDWNARRISGTPQAGEQGNHTLIDQARDLINQTVEFKPVLQVLNRPPEFKQIFSDIDVTTGEFFSLDIPQNLGVDPDGDAVTLTIKINSPWLIAVGYQLLGMPEAGVSAVNLMLRDAFNAANETTFRVIVSKQPPDSNSSNDNPAWIPVVAAIGSLAACGALAAGGFFARRHCRKRKVGLVVGAFSVKENPSNVSNCAQLVADLLQYKEKQKVFSEIAKQKSGDTVASHLAFTEVIEKGKQLGTDIKRLKDSILRRIEQLDVQEINTWNDGELTQGQIVQTEPLLFYLLDTPEFFMAMLEKPNVQIKVQDSLRNTVLHKLVARRQLMSLEEKRSDQFSEQIVQHAKVQQVRKGLVNMANQLGQTPYTLAQQHEDTKLLRLFESLGASVNLYQGPAFLRRRAPTADVEISHASLSGGVRAPDDLEEGKNNGNGGDSSMKLAV